MTQQVWLKPANPKAFTRAQKWGAQWHSMESLFTLLADHRMLADAAIYGLTIVPAPAKKENVFDSYDGTSQYDG